LSSGDQFTTLDVIEIYRRSILAPGSFMPQVRIHTCVTTWSYEDGLPLASSLITEEEQPKWTAKIIVGSVASYLMCLPVYSSSEFHYFVSGETKQVGYSPLSPRLSGTQRYDNYIPLDMVKKALFQSGCGEDSRC